MNDLVTGRTAGYTANSNDVDRGVTSIRSPAIMLPIGEDLQLSFFYSFAHASNSSNADYLRVKVIGMTSLTVLEELGAPINLNGNWSMKVVNLNAFAGQTIRIVVEVTDGGRDSLVEAAIDDVRITRQ